MANDSLAIKITNFYQNDGFIDAKEQKELEQEFYWNKANKAAQIANAVNNDGVVDQKDNLSALGEIDKQTLLSLGPKPFQIRATELIQQLEKNPAQRTQQAITELATKASSPHFNAKIDGTIVFFTQSLHFEGGNVNLSPEIKTIFSKASQNAIDQREKIISNPVVPLEQRRAAWHELYALLSAKTNLTKNPHYDSNQPEIEPEEIIEAPEVEKLLYNKSRSPQLRALAFAVLCLQSNLNHKKTEFEQEYKSFEEDYQKFIPLADNNKGPTFKVHSKFTLVHIWSTFCNPCMRELPEMLRMANALASQGVKINIYADEIPNSLYEAKGRFLLLGGNSGHHKVLSATINFNGYHKLGIKQASLPVTGILMNGKVIWKQIGTLNSQQFKKIENYFRQGDFSQVKTAAQIFK